ncbi:MAG: NAD(P)/FAD-dependent oxidoreductase [Candidatus Protistobacter heckmanni]|nr:NAD(P)/FAD-dependent oxidoreductase [Candidatus Protistobacter heckmanni]
MKRRQLLQALAAAGIAPHMAAALAAEAAPQPATGGLGKARVVVVGGGFGGATAAKYLRLFSNYTLDVTLVEPSPALVSCSLSNLVIGGSKILSDVTVSMDTLATRHGVRLVRDRAAAIDPGKKQVRLAAGGVLPYDRLILSPGVDFIWDALPATAGAGKDEARAQVLHAWKAGPQTVELRRRLEAMPDGGVFAISIPELPYRCPPAPYERACQAAWYLKQAKPKSKVLVLDANPDITAKPALFRKAWAELYPGLIDYQPLFALTDVDLKENTMKFEVQDDIRADVLNIVPPMRAGDIAVRSGLATANGRWCGVEFLSFESVAAPGVHVLGDAIQVAQAMPKSAHMANQHGKVAAAAVVALLGGRSPEAAPLYANTCYSFVSPDEVVHVASVHRYDAAHRTMLPVPGAGGLSASLNKTEGRYAIAWARNIWADTLN